MFILEELVLAVPRLQLADDLDLQQAFAAHLRGLREQARLSRKALVQCRQQVETETTEAQAENAQ